MKSYYRTTRMEDGIPLKCFTQRYIQDLENMDITSRYSKNVEPSGEGKDKSSPHILIELSTDQFNTLKSITKEVNEKYFEMGGNYNRFTELYVIVQDLFEKGLEDYGEVIREEYFEDVENELKYENQMKEEQERNKRNE